MSSAPATTRKREWLEAWDPEDERVVIEAQEVTEGDEEEAEVGSENPATAVLRVRITAGQARAFTQSRAIRSLTRWWTPRSCRASPQLIPWVALEWPTTWACPTLR